MVVATALRAVINALMTELSFPRRPPRLGRVFSSLDPFYFVTFNSYRRLPWLNAPEVLAAFQTFCVQAEQHQVAVGRFVIMPDHVHLFVMMPREGRTLSAWIKSLKCVLGKCADARGVPRPRWQEGFFDHLLRSGESYAEKWNYVRMNPVRAGLCVEPEAWPYQGEIMPIRF